MPCDDWRGHWLSLNDLSVLMGKKYERVRQMQKTGELNSPGMKFIWISGRTWVRIDQEVYESLSR